MNLFQAEFGRLFARRFVRLMLVLLVAAFGITIATTLANSHKPTSEELTSAQQQADSQLQQQQEWYRQCLASKRPADDGSTGRPFPQNCEEIKVVQADTSRFLPGVFVLERQIRPLTYFLITFLVLFAFLVGASYIGADLNSGGMTNLLLWRPRRIAVLGTKLGTLLATTLGVSLVAGTIYLGAFWAIAATRGSLGDLDAQFVSWLFLTSGRGLVLVLMAGTLGFAIATLGRHTAAALGVVAAYAVVWEAGARIVMEIVETSRTDQWMLSTHVGAWMLGRMELWDSNGCATAFSNTCDPRYVVTWQASLIVLLVLVGGLTAAAFAAFQRRDLA